MKLNFFRLFNSSKHALAGQEGGENIKAGFMGRLIEGLVLTLLFILLSLLPFNSIAIDLLNNKLGVSRYVTLWKEFIIVLLMVVFTLGVFKSITNPVSKVLKSYSDLLMFGSAIFIIVFSILTSFKEKVPLNIIALGFRVEILFIVFLVLFYLYSKTLEARQLLRLRKVLLSSSVFSFLGVFLVAALSLYFTPEVFYLALGQKSGWGGNGLFLESPICHSIDTISGCRLSAGFSTPVNLSAYLLLELGIFIYIFFTSKNTYTRSAMALTIALSLFMLQQTYSRFVVVAIVLALVFWAFKFLASKISQNISQKFSLGLSVQKFLFFLVFIVSLALPIFVNYALLEIANKPDYLSSLPTYISKPGSTDGHSKLNRISYDVLSKKFAKDYQSVVFGGYGLGQTGSIAKPLYYDVENRPFVLNNKEIIDGYSMPRDRAAIPENWYMQVLLNGGVIYLACYLFILLFFLYPFKKQTKNSLILVSTLYAIYVSNFFLHIWENSAVAYYTVIVAILIGLDDGHK